MTAPRTLAFSSARHDARRRRWRVLLTFVGLLLLAVAAWAVLVAGVWAYAWLRLSGDEITAFDDDVTPLGSAQVSAPAGTTTVLIALTESVDPTVPRPSELIAEPVLLQYGGPRERPVALVLPERLRVTVDGEGELPLDEVQLEGGADLLVRAVTDYTQVRIDHVLSASVDALPRLVELVGPLQACREERCAVETADELRITAAQSTPEQLIDHVGASVAALAAEVDGGWVLRSPWRAKRLVDVVDREFRTDVSLRGSALLDVATAMAGAGGVQVVQLPAVQHPDTGRSIILEEPAAVRFQQLREGTPFSSDASDEDTTELVADASVAVLNGAGIDGLAGEVRVRLEAQGFMVAGTGNARDFDRERTVVNYRSGDESVEVAAVLLARELGGAALEPLEQRPTFEGDEIDLLVTAGRDQDES